MNSLLKLTEELVLKNNGRKSFNTWSSDTDREIYFYFLREFKEKNINAFCGENGDYLVYYKSGHSGSGGMDDGKPNEMIVEKLKWI